MKRYNLIKIIVWQFIEGNYKEIILYLFNFLLHTKKCNSYTVIIDL